MGRITCFDWRAKSAGFPLGEILPWLLIVPVYVAARVHFINVPLNRDEGSFGYFGQVILKHGVLYRDIADGKPPLAFFLYALALLFVPSTSAGIHIFLHIYNFLTVVSLYILARVLWKRASVAFWTALVYAVFSSSPAILGFTASMEMFMLLPITLSLLFAVLAVQRRAPAYLLASGVSGSLACWTKQSAVFSILFVLIYVCVSLRAAGREKPRPGLLSGLFLWFAGGLAVSAMITAYFYFKKALPDFFYWNFIYDFYYGKAFTYATKLTILKTSLHRLVMEDFPVLGIGLFSAVYAALKKDGKGYFILGFLGFSFIGALPGAGYPHYFAQILPAASLAAGFGASGILANTRATLRKIAYPLMAALLILVPVWASGKYYFQKNPDAISGLLFGYNPFPEAKQIAKYISARTGPDARVFIIGSEPEILFYSRRMNATPYPWWAHIMPTHPRYPDCLIKTWKELAGNPPEYIIDIPFSPSLGVDLKAASPYVARIESIVGRYYHLEAVMVVGRDKSFMVQGPALEDGFDETASGGVAYRISLYRRNY